jgi:hypothetical protein
LIGRWKKQKGVDCPCYEKQVVVKPMSLRDNMWVEIIKEFGFSVP